MTDNGDHIHSFGRIRRIPAAGQAKLLLLAATGGEVECTDHVQAEYQSSNR
jgi:hypothetical protein